MLLFVVDINTKSHGGCCRLRLFVAVGDGSRKTSFPPCRRRHPQRHALHDDNSRHGSKSGLWPFKKSAFGGEKTAACKPPPQPSPRGGNSFSLCLRRLWCTPSPWEGTEKVPFFYDQNGKCLRFVTSLSANRLNKGKTAISPSSTFNLIVGFSFSVPSLGEGWDGASLRQLCRSCDFIAQG